MQIDDDLLRLLSLKEDIAPVGSSVDEWVIDFSHSFINIDADIFRLLGDNFDRAGQGISVGFSINMSVRGEAEAASRELVPTVKISAPAHKVEDSPQTTSRAFSSC